MSITYQQLAKQFGTSVKDVLNAKREVIGNKHKVTPAELDQIMEIIQRKVAAK